MSISLRGVGRLDVPTDPLEALAVNDAHRRPDVADGLGGDIWPIDEVRRLMPREYDYRYATFAPSIWAPPEPTSQADYTERFRAAFPLAAAILPIPHVVVAGNAAAWPLRSRMSRADRATADCEFYIYGIASDDRDALWRKVSEIMMRLFDANIAETEGDRRNLACVTNEEKYSVLRVLSEGAVTLHFHRDKAVVKAKIILRAYESVSAILHTVAVPSCAVAYDGTLAATTTLGAYACIHRANLVIPGYREESYEDQLAKQMSLGYALILPRLRKDAFKSTGTLRLPHMSLSIQAECAPLYVGYVLDTPSLDLADVDGALPAIDRINSLDNLRSHVGKKGHYFSAKRAVLGDDAAFREIDVNPLAESILSDVFPIAVLEDLTARAITASTLSYGHIGVLQLRQRLGLSAEDVGAVCATLAVSDANIGAWDAVVEYTLMPYRDALLARYDGGLKLQWWLEPPGRSVSTSDAEWYGAYAAEPQPDSASALLHSVEAYRRDGLGACGLCGHAAEPGSPNVVEMSCGHVYHVAMAHACAGVVGFEGGRCPICAGRNTMSVLGFITGLSQRAKEPPGPLEPVECVICLRPPATLLDAGRAVLMCGHEFHWRGECEGVSTWLKSSNTCPLCRTQIVPSLSASPPVRTLSPRRTTASTVRAVRVLEES